MVARTREILELDQNQGYRKSISGGTVYQQAIKRIHNVCTDHVVEGDNHPFDVLHYVADGGNINRNYTGTAQTGTSFINYPADVMRFDSQFPHLTVNECPSDATAAVNGVARSNPSRPYVDVPVAVLELGELPMLLKDAGQTVFREAAGYNIKYQFGIAPLVGDLVKLVNFYDQVERRIREIHKLVSKNGLRRTVTTQKGGYSAQAIDSKSCQSIGVTIRQDFTANTSVNLKVHCRWKPVLNHAFPRSQSEIRHAAIRAVLGLTLDSSTVWEAVPWTWLMDWCTNVGEYLKTQRNIIPASMPDPPRVMRHTKTTWSCPPVTIGGTWPTRMDGITVTRETKTRNLVSNSPTAHFPFITGRQLGIIASLSILSTGRP